MIVSGKQLNKIARFADSNVMEVIVDLAQIKDLEKTNPGIVFSHDAPIFWVDLKALYGIDETQTDQCIPVRDHFIKKFDATKFEALTFNNITEYPQLIDEFVFSIDFENLQEFKEKLSRDLVIIQNILKSVEVSFFSFNTKNS